MLDLDRWITRLEAARQAGRLGELRAVEGAIELGSLEEGGRRRPPRNAPQAWVLPALEQAGRNTAMQGVEQQVIVHVGVVYAVRNRADLTGAAGHRDLHAIRRAVCAELIGWTPDDAALRVAYARGRLLDYDDAVLWWQDEFATTYDIRQL